MTQEEKRLLIKDICARLPYGVKTKYIFDDGSHCPFELSTKILQECLDKGFLPYLRSMSSMTEEERKYLLEELGFDEDLENGELNDFGSYVYRSVNVLPLFDWLNEHHFDWRGLIPMGLALEAPVDMYNLNVRKEENK